MQSGKITVDNILAVLWKPRKQHCILLYTTYLYRKCVKISIIHTVHYLSYFHNVQNDRRLKIYR